MENRQRPTVSDEAVSSKLRAHFRKRQRDCYVEKDAYAIWLALLTPVRWFTVIGGIVLSAVAGAVVLLAEYRVIGDQWRVYGAICAITASVLTGIHTALNCDAHQTECRRLVQLYSGLESRFEAASILPAERIEATFDELEAKFEEAHVEAAASPPEWCRRRANVA
jgi:hypothetical protein